MVAPMLATPGVPTDDLRSYSVEPKLDGRRIIVRANRYGVRISTRRGRDVSDAMPALRAAEFDCEAILDGELVAAQGRAGDFYRVAPTVAARPPGLTLVMFDLLWLDGESLVDETDDARRAWLAHLDLPAPIAKLPSWPGTMAPHLFRACEEHEVEGIVLKRRP
jgi:bifunctional non-homologous end joining protein LigD